MRSRALRMEVEGEAGPTHRRPTRSADGGDVPRRPRPQRRASRGRRPPAPGSGCWACSARCCSFGGPARVLQTKRPESAARPSRERPRRPLDAATPAHDRALQTMGPVPIRPTGSAGAERVARRGSARGRARTRRPGARRRREGIPSARRRAREDGGERSWWGRWASGKRTDGEPSRGRDESGCAYRTTVTRRVV